MRWWRCEGVFVKTIHWLIWWICSVNVQQMVSSAGCSRSFLTVPLLSAVAKWSCVVSLLTFHCTHLTFTLQKLIKGTKASLHGMQSMVPSRRTAPLDIYHCCDVFLFFACFVLFAFLCYCHVAYNGTIAQNHQHNTVFSTGNNNNF